MKTPPCLGSNLLSTKAAKATGLAWPSREDRARARRPQSEVENLRPRVSHLPQSCTPPLQSFLNSFKPKFSLKHARDRMAFDRNVANRAEDFLVKIVAMGALTFLRCM